MWSMTLNASELMNESVQPRRYGTRMRCPELEIGRNSVSPCTIPMTTAWTIVSIDAPRADDRSSASPG